MIATFNRLKRSGILLFGLFILSSRTSLSVSVLWGDESLSDESSRAGVKTTEVRLPFWLCKKGGNKRERDKFRGKLKLQNHHRPLHKTGTSRCSTPTPWCRYQYQFHRAISILSFRTLPRPPHSEQLSNNNKTDILYDISSLKYCNGHY